MDTVNGSMIKVKKSNITYILIYALVPVLVLGLSVYYLFFTKAELGIMAKLAVEVVIVLLGAFWYWAGNTVLYAWKRKRFEKQLDKTGFVRNQTFRAEKAYVYVDQVNGLIGVIFKWNPFNPAIVPASRMKKSWIDDGKSGAGKNKGSKKVCLYLTVDHVKIQITTFHSLEKFQMDSEQIKGGIEKATHKQNALEDAKRIFLFKQQNPEETVDAEQAGEEYEIENEDLHKKDKAKKTDAKAKEED